VALYAPYCEGVSRSRELQRALALLPAGSLVGERQLRPSGVRRFRLSWQPGPSPLDRAAVLLQFDHASDRPGVDYRFDLPNYRLVLWLMDWLDAGGSVDQPVDLPDQFWRWLILGLDPTAVAA